MNKESIKIQIIYQIAPTVICIPLFCTEFSIDNVKKTVKRENHIITGTILYLCASRRHQNHRLEFNSSLIAEIGV